MRADRGDLLLMAFRRRRPLRFAALVYLTWVGTAAISVEIAVPRFRDSTMFRFVLPLCMTAPALLGVVRRGRHTRRVIGAGSSDAEPGAAPDPARDIGSGGS
jgi:hypothetical protein